MSYEIAKAITINEKKGTVRVCSACNNCRPLWYGTSDIKGDTFYEKMCNLLSDVSGGCIQPNRSLYRFNQAFEKAEKLTGVNMWEACNPSITMYALKGTKPHWRYPDSFIDEVTDEYEECSTIYGYQLYVNKEERKEVQRTSEENKNKFYDAFMKFYNIEGIKKGDSYYVVYDCDYMGSRCCYLAGRMIYMSANIHKMDYFKSQYVLSAMEKKAGTADRVYIKEVEI